MRAMSRACHPNASNRSNTYRIARRSIRVSDCRLHPLVAHQIPGVNLECKGAEGFIVDVACGHDAARGTGVARARGEGRGSFAALTVHVGVAEHVTARHEQKGRKAEEE